MINILNNKLLKNWILPIFAAVCGTVAFFLIFAKAASLTPFLITNSYSGLRVAFGYTVNNVVLFTFNVGIALGFVLPLFAACVIIIGNGNKVAAGVAAALFLAGAVLVFCTVPLLNFSAAANAKIAIGAILSGVFSLLGMLACTSLIVLKK